MGLTSESRPSGVLIVVFPGRLVRKGRPIPMGRFSESPKARVKVAAKAALRLATRHHGTCLHGSSTSSKLKAGATRNCLITASSSGSPTSVDAVKTVVKIK